MPELNIALAQMNPLVGDIDGNTDKIIAYAEQAKSEQNANLVLFPELTITGYPPEDLLLRPSLELRVTQALDRLKSDIPKDVAVVVGYPAHKNGTLLNMAGVIHDGELIFEYAKRCLPNYQVFDEKRYFSEGKEHSQFGFKGLKLGLSICEDIWDGAPIIEMHDAGLDLVLNLNASPFHKNKQVQRETLVSERARNIEAPILYVNQVGGQDELVFDGGSMAFDQNGELIARASLFEAQLLYLRFSSESGELKPISDTPIAQRESELATIYQALVIGVRDYVNKNGFKGVVLGLSGGIDSALTLAVAVDALGADRVEAVMMPFTYTSDLSKNDAEDEARRLGVCYRSISIEHIYSAFNTSLNDAFSGHSADKTEENIQARSRGVLLMALSNKLGYLVLTTGNKSEMAVGYATLYGDMAGGLDVLKDVPKTVVFELSRYRNTVSEVIPESVITRPPSAELAPDQKDEDTLPPYEVLDQILELYIEQDMSAASIIERGFEADSVNQVLRMVDLNEYKRRQAPIGIRISERAFGRDRRYPITNGWKIGR